MLHYVITLVLSLVLLPDRGLADYPCACNYHTSRNVYGSPSTLQMPVSTLYKDECKAVLDVPNESSHWIAVAVQHQVGYLRTDYLVREQICSGSPDPSDIVSTSTKPTSTRISSKQPSSTTFKPKYTQSPWGMLTPKPSKSTHKVLTVSSSTLTPIYRPKPVVSGDTSLCSGVLHTLALQNVIDLNQYGDQCLLLVTTHVIWQEAEWQCRLNYGHLLTITDQAQNDFITEFLNNNTFFPLWIGLNDIKHEETFQWAADPNMNVGYTKWTPNHHTNHHGAEDCVTIAPDGQWDDRRCGHYNTEDNLAAKYGFICQYDINNAKQSVLVG